jgi:hypothetical protein
MIKLILTTTAIALGLILLHGTAAGIPVNLLTNPGFEDGVIAPWTGSAWSVTSGDAHTGTYCAENTSGSSLQQMIAPVAVGDVLEISLYCKSPDMVNHVVRLLYSPSGGDWDEFPHEHGGSSWTRFDLTSRIRSSGQLHGISISGHYDHIFRIDDAKIMVDGPVDIKPATWGRVKDFFNE